MERYANSAYSTLTSGITAGDLSLTVQSGHGARFPSSGDFRIKIDSELMICTARSTDTLTVTRGAEGTTAASHSAGAAVNHVITAASLAALLQTVTYTAFTPTVSQNGAVSSTVARARYAILGKFVHVMALLGITSAGSAGNDIAITMPAAISPHSSYALLTVPVGTALLFDQGTTFYTGVQAVFTNATTLKFWAAGSGTAHHGTSPSWALAAGDSIALDLMYELAA